MIRFCKSFGHAIKGLWYTFAHENNFRVHVAATLLAIGLGGWFEISVSEWLVLIVTVTLVLVLELINTAVEKLLDSVHPRLHATVGLVKDILAGAVLVSAIMAVIVGGLIFIPYLLEP